MIRVIVAATAALLFLGAHPWAPPAAATDGDQTILVQNGQIRCVLSTDWEGRGRAATACARTDGAPFAVAPKGTDLAVSVWSGQLYFVKGTIPGPDDVVLGVGESYRANGWTVKTEELRTLITYDIGGHGIRVNPVEVAVVWI